MHRPMTYCENPAACEAIANDPTVGYITVRCAALMLAGICEVCPRVLRQHGDTALDGKVQVKPGDVHLPWSSCAQQNTP